MRSILLFGSSHELPFLESLNCRFHDLRHTAVTRLLEAGIPYPVVASMMGWSAATAIRMAKAKRYGHIGSQALREAADVLGDSKFLRDPSKGPQSRLRWKMSRCSKSMKRIGSSGRTRTYNPSVNSRMLCH